VAKLSKSASLIVNMYDFNTFPVEVRVFLCAEAGYDPTEVDLKFKVAAQFTPPLLAPATANRTKLELNSEFETQ
jgi:hypothetical protein